MLTEIDRILLSFLKSCGVGADKAAMIGIILETEENRFALAEYLRNNEDVTEQQITDEAFRLAGL